MDGRRLIDANALMKNIGKIPQLRGITYGRMKKAVKETPTIDAVSVVRCRECKHYSGRNDKPGEVTAIGYCDHPNHHIMPLRADWFCADGKRIAEKEDTADGSDA